VLEAYYYRPAALETRQKAIHNKDGGTTRQLISTIVSIIDTIGLLGIITGQPDAINYSLAL